MKKILPLILCFILLFSGCGLTVEKVDNSATTALQEETTVTDEITETSSSETEEKSNESTTVKESTTKSEVTQKTENTTKIKKPETTTKKQNTCTFVIECKTILNNIENLKESKKEFLPADGVILKKTTVTFEDGETVFDVLKKVCKENNVQLESSYTPGYDNYYIEGINQIYEKDCGTKSGWMYCVNGTFPNYGCSDYKLKNGDEIKFLYTCDLGADIGDNSF
ncbi:MAG: DUF4430 domain-containing protein [Clostridia bacterium]|nr:DUF4430 domain-containing protein [Clostridia bacterium]